MASCICKLWPLIPILPLITLLCVTQVDINMLQRVSSYCDVRKVLQIPGRAKAPTVSKSLPNDIGTTLVHYATTSVTPQQTHAEITVTLNILRHRGPCNFLVYGLGHDSPMWQALNHGGLTIFLEEDHEWIEKMTTAHPSLQAYHVKYSTMLSQADDLLAYARGNKHICSPKQDLLHSHCKLAIKSFPPKVYEIRWDVIMIDAPTGYYAEAPGRMSAIFSSSVMANAKKKSERTDILLHDVERHVEKAFGLEFLCRKHLRQTVGKLWHFEVYGEGSSKSPGFCTL